MPFWHGGVELWALRDATLPAHPMVPLRREETCMKPYTRNSLGNVAFRVSRAEKLFNFP